MHKAAHHSDGVDSANLRCWRGEWLHHHGGGVCWLFVLLWMDLWCHKLIVCKKWYKNNLKMRLTALLFDPPRHASHPHAVLLTSPSSYLVDNSPLPLARHFSQQHPKVHKACVARGGFLQGCRHQPDWTNKFREFVSTPQSTFRKGKRKKRLWGFEEVANNSCGDWQTRWRWLPQRGGGWGNRGNNMTTGNNKDGQHKQQSHRTWYRLEEDGGGDGNDGGLRKCKGMTVATVGGMATTRGGKGWLWH